MMRFVYLLALAVAAPALAQNADPHAGHSMHQDMQQDTQHEAPAPKPVAAANDYMADQYYDPARMAQARAALFKGMGEAQLIVKMEQLEWRSDQGRDGYGWEAKASYGGDLDKLLLRSEGEGTSGEALETGEIQALWSHALDHLYNLELGARQDFGAGPKPTYAVLGVQGVAPYWVELESALYLSHKGDVEARIKAAHDMRLTQKWIVQPEVEMNFALQNIPERHIGAGLADISAGLRLRYEIIKELAPYIGFLYERQFGRTADFTRAQGEKPHSSRLVLGVSFWF